MLRFALGGVLCLAACYRPTEELECAPCDPRRGNSDCLEGELCNDQGLCAVDGASCSSAEAFCVGTAPIRPCFATPPSGPIDSLTGFDTGDDCPLVMTLDGREACVIAADTISITNDALFTGSRPVVIVGVTSISVKSTGVLDVASSTNLALRRGAGSDPVDCVAPAPVVTAGDGGGGGAFAPGGGGDGGASSGSAGGRPGGVADPVGFRGGCSGADGKTGNPGGIGGGAIYVITDRLILDGLILATATGGAGGPPDGGGAGGGSGGYVGIDAATIELGTTARIVATGGGGGGGGCAAPGQSGSDSDGNLHIVATGGAGDDVAGAGGVGGAVRGVAAQAGGSSATCGGGGGGGGVGAIQVFRSQACPANVCTPQAETLP